LDQVSSVNLIAVAIVMAVAAAIPALWPRLPVPGVVLEIVLGAIIGPQILGIVHAGVALNFLAGFGLGMLFMIAGFEMDPAVLRGRPIRNALIGWVITAGIALAAGAILYATGLARAPILTALALSTTTIGALIPVLRDIGVLGPPDGPMVLAAGAIGEAAPVRRRPARATITTSILGNPPATALQSRSAQSESANRRNNAKKKTRS
jgi:Kef-type K+ transport system membrane component KefB